MERRADAQPQAGRLRPGLPVLWRSLTEVQLGTDPRWAVALGDLSPSATRALHAVAPGSDLRTVRAALGREQVPADEAARVVEHLVRAGAVVPLTTSAVGPDRIAWSLAAGDPAVVAERARHRVRIEGLGRLGAVLATTLVSAGVRLVELDDDAPVTSHDTGVGGLSSRDVGSERAGALARLLHDVDPAVCTAPHGRRPHDLVVVVEPGTADPVRYRRLLADGTTHLSVVVREASVLVGPLVEPGRTSCLGCADLHRCDVDPAWPAVGTQLAAGSVPAGVESTLAAVAGAVAAAQALAHLDGRPTAVRDGALEIRLPDALPRRVELPAHPECGCLALAGTSTSEPAAVAGYA